MGSRLDLVSLFQRLKLGVHQDRGGFRHVLSHSHNFSFIWSAAKRGGGF